MKISIDGILGSAKRINSQRSPDQESKEKKKKEVGADSIEIRNKVLSRLETIQKEFKEIQSSLTMNQIINDGMKKLRDDLAKGSEHKDAIMDEVRFDNKKVLHAFIGESVTEEILGTKQERLDNLIKDDISGLRRLQIEVENILASNLTDADRVEDIMKNIESYFSREGIASLDTISQLRADSVMRLIR
jgi:hypothetical protein